ncbi:MAG: CoA transferase [Alphaproteobacteria bacterium]|nr:CoA transferase [Alphaproteobacteria bacterium]
MAAGLFEDLLVIDCASFIAGPAAATIMADFGARVIKVEPPGMGDSYRQFRYMTGSPKAEMDYGWVLDNRNKESLALDLKQPEARAILEDLLRKADVFITNFPGPVRDKLKLRAEDLMPLNDRLIYASITPYGEFGPDKDRTGYDTTAWWARSGLMDHVRAAPDLPPGFSTPGMGDHPTATALYAGIVSALYRRMKTGKGDHVTTSLLANGLWSNGVLLQAALCGADLYAPRDRSALANLYRCRCGRWFILAIINDTRDWPRLLACLGVEAWADDPRFATSELRKANVADLAARMSELFGTDDFSVWGARLAAAGIPIGHIGRTVDHFEDAQVAANAFLKPISDQPELRTIDSPVRLDGIAKSEPRLAPDIGQHSAAILAELGLSRDEIDRLAAQGAVGLSG